MNDSSINTTSTAVAFFILVSSIVVLSTLSNGASTADEKMFKNPQNVVEICVSDMESVCQAVAGGANSIEICCDRNCGGVTASMGLLEEAVQHCRNKSAVIHALIRPNDGPFNYSDRDFDIIVRDILRAKQAGVHGIVVGILNSDGSIDMDRMKAIRSITSGMLLTFHRAVDVCSESLPVIMNHLTELHCDRVLTSGAANSAMTGASAISTMASCLDRRGIQVVAAAGIHCGNVRDLILTTGVSAVHIGSGATTTSTSAAAEKHSDSASSGSNSSQEQRSVGVVTMAPAMATSSSTSNCTRVRQSLVQQLVVRSVDAWGYLKKTRSAAILSMSLSSLSLPSHTLSHHHDCVQDKDEEEEEENKEEIVLIDNEDLHSEVTSSEELQLETEQGLLQCFAEFALTILTEYFDARNENSEKEEIDESLTRSSLIDDIQLCENSHLGADDSSGANGLAITMPDIALLAGSYVNVGTDYDSKGTC